MPHIHYKFSSKLSYDTVVFDGPHVTLEELKRRIMGREKLRAADCDLQITNAQSKEEFTDDNSLIHKGSSVIVRRIPISGVKPSPSSKIHNIEQSDAQHHHAFGASRAMDDQSSTGALSFFSKMQMANLVDADVSEEDKIKFMIYQSSHDSMSLNKRLGSALPMNYTCYRCGNTGHHIRNCPTSGDKNFEAPLRIKKSTGIPRSFMVEVDDPTMKGAMLTNYGRYAIPAVDAEAYAIGKKEKPPFIPQEQPKSEDEDDPIPEELLCLICGDLLSDAVVIPCCGNSYCDDCIRTTLLDSEDHVCPSCGQLDVSPDTLIANRFLRQTVNNFKRERSNTKTLKRKSDTSQTQNSTPTPSPVAAPPPPVTAQNQLQKPQLSPNSKQDSLLEHPKATNSPPSSQGSGPPLTLTGPECAHSTPISSLQPVQNSLETSEKETEGNTLDDSVATSSVLVSNKDPTDAPSEPIPLVNHTVVAEQPQTVSVNQQPSSADRASRPSGSSNSWDSSSSSSGYPSSLPSSSPYPATPPPLFPSPLFHTFLLAHQSHGSYPPGYPPATPVWTLPTPQGAPIPPLCSSASSIPALIPKEWYRYQRKKRERSPHRGSSYRRPSSHSNSRSSKSKSSRSYSRSSSRSGSRSRSRSQSKSRPRSPYSRQRDRRTRSPPSCSYTFGYKRSRSPTPSSSSSPRVGYHSRSKSPSDHWRNRHHGKKSASSSYSSRRRGECSGRESGGPGSSSTRHLYGQHANQTSSQDLEREHYMQWKYKEWYEKHFSSYVGQFPQMPLPLINLLPPPCPQLEDREESRNHSHANLDSRYRPQGKHTTRVDGRSPSSESSSDSRSPPSQSSSDSLSTPSHSSSGSRSSLSHKDTDSRSPPSQSSSDGRSTPSEDGAQSCTGKHKSPATTPTRNSEEVDLQEQNTDDKQPILKKLEHFSTLKHEHKRMKEVDKGRGENSSLDSTDDSRKGQRRKSSGPSSCKDDTPVKNKATDKDASESLPLKRNKPSDKDYERKVKGEKNLEREKGSRRGKDSDSRHKEERQPRKRELDTDREEPSRGSRAPDSRSEKNRKRKVENLERNEKESSLSGKPESIKCLKTETTENLESCKSDSLIQLDREEKKKEKKTWPLHEHRDM